MNSLNGRENQPNIGNGLMFGVIVAHSGTSGRAKVYIPEIHGETQPDEADLPEAIIPFQYGGVEGTGLIAIPPVGAGVIVGFLLGLAWSPVIIGTYYGSEGIPGGLASPQDKAVTLINGQWMIKMDFSSGNGNLEISGPGDVTIKAGGKIEFISRGEASMSSMAGITLKTPQSTMWKPLTTPVAPSPGSPLSTITDLKGGVPTPI